MNDIILSSLIHLFALFGARKSLNKEKSIDRISAYLTRFFGIRNLKSYVRLYNDLREFYDDSEGMDKDAVVDSICSQLSSKIRRDEEITLLLRLMEFCHSENAFDPSDDIFRRIASAFSISSDIYGTMVDFMQTKAGPDVLVMELNDDCGTIKTLRLKEDKLLFVTYIGSHSIWMDDIRMLPGVFQIWQQSSLLKSSHFKPMYYSTIMKMYGSEKSEDIQFSGRDINFRFEQGGDNGMHNLSYDLHSGELVAIMGGSGVGKSTLLSLLNGTLKPQSGSITINGHDISEPEAIRMIGFVPQDDLLIEELTVFQNLWYTAKLCFDKMPDNELDARVDKVLGELGLSAARDLKVGSPVNKFISGGQRKRLNIALELIREPSVLFLDEPTSGLSSTDTEKVVRILKELSDRGKLVIANIHQPSSDVYKLFDRLWLLDKGGYPIYDGNPIQAISYFKTAANYADARSSACPTCGNVNPEIVLNIIDEKQLDNSGKVTDERKLSPKEWHEMYLKERPQMEEPARKAVPPSDQKRPNRLIQTAIFFRRNVRAKFSNLQYILVTLLEAPILAVICAMLTHYAGSDGYTLMGNSNFPSYLFMAIIVATFLGMSGSAEEIIKDRAILKREKFLRLSYGSYIWSKILYMACVCFVQTTLFILVGNLITGVHGMFLIWLAVLFMSAFLSALIGLLLSKLMNSVVAIYITIPLLLIPQILLCGLVVKFDDLTPDSTTGNVPVIGDVIPSRWAYEALAVASFSMNDYESQFFEQDRKRYESLYYSEGFIPRLETANEMRDKYGDLLKKEIHTLSQVCSGLEDYSGDWSYESVESYLSDAKKALRNQINNAARLVDKQVGSYIKEHSKDELVQLKKDCFNTQLESLVTNRHTESLCHVVKDNIIPRSGYIYLTPRSRNGRAQFYSGVKRISDRLIPTLHFNLGVMFLMCILIGLCLFSEFSMKDVKKNYICSKLFNK